MSELESQLLDFYAPDGPERVGFVLQSGEVVEVVNQCAEPEHGFDVSADDLIKFGPDAAATWHTHPGSSANLSVNDYESFLSWPAQAHYIVGTNGLRRYVVSEGEVIVESP